MSVPYGELDKNIVSLVRALNEYPGVDTVGSCGGHADASPAQAPEGEWWVKFDIAPNDVGWRTLEFLAWLINNDMRRAGRKALLLPVSPPPYLNFPGDMLSFVLEGWGNEDAERLADWIDELRETYYVPVGSANS